MSISNNIIGLARAPHLLVTEEQMAVDKYEGGGGRGGGRGVGGLMGGGGGGGRGGGGVRRGDGGWGGVIKRDRSILADCQLG